MNAKAQLSELLDVSEDARELSEAGHSYILLPGLQLPAGCNPSRTDGLLCITSRDGYPTRLFLSERVEGRGQNWNTYRILDRNWHSCSWTGVQPGRLVEVLAQHFRAFR